MRKTRCDDELFVSAEEAVADIVSGAVVASTGVIGWITPDSLLAALGNRFRLSQEPTGLTFYFPVATGDSMSIKGMDHVAQEGLMKRIISGSYVNPTDPLTGRRPELMRLIRENKIEAYSWPIGATMHWLREVSRRSPGYFTKIGLGTYVDPRLGGGKFTQRTTEDLIRVIEIEGEEYLFYPTWPIDVALIRASSSDEAGNLSWEDEPLISSSIAMAIAAKASGGTVIAQVRRIVDSTSRPATMARLPGHFVDRVVVEPDMPMTTNVDYDTAYISHPRMRLCDLPRMPMSMGRIIASRVAEEVRPGEMSIFGFGSATDAPLIMAEQGLFEDDRCRNYQSTTEHGVYGGVVMPGWQFSANINPDALLDGVTQFDAIDGGICRFAALSFAQFDVAGSINVSKFAGINPGAGGFIDIAHNARRLIFAGTFTTSGLDVSISDIGIEIKREGKVRKFVQAVESVTYRAMEGVQLRGQEALIVTERAVFRITDIGLELIEIAPGVDVHHDILDQMDFAPVRILDPLPLMAAHHFTGKNK